MPAPFVGTFQTSQPSDSSTALPSFVQPSGARGGGTRSL